MTVPASPVELPQPIDEFVTRGMLLASAWCRGFCEKEFNGQEPMRLAHDELKLFLTSFGQQCYEAGVSEGLRRASKETHDDARGT